MYDRRPGTTTTTPGTAAPSSSQDAAQLEGEVADLRAALKIAQVDLEQARVNVETFKGIAKAAEEALAQGQETFDLFKTQNEAELAAKTVRFCFRLVMLLLTDMKPCRRRWQRLSSEL